MVFKRFFGRYRDFSKQNPLSCAFATCFVKGACSDLFAQKFVEKKEVNWRRNLCFATYSGAYCGVAQHFVYNVYFTKWFGSGQDIMTATKKVAADALVHVPFIYLPVYYIFENGVLAGEGPSKSLKKWREQLWQVMKAYWSVWTVFHFVNFTLTPPELRIGAIACVSFIWLIIISFISHKSILGEKNENHASEADEPAA